MNWSTAKIPGVLSRPLNPFADDRGWLVELFRTDELTTDHSPAMAYLSETKPGVVRGPHEHLDQTDCFCFLGPFQIDLWDNRPESATYQLHERITTGPADWLQLIIPPRVVHAYTNVGANPALVVNCPNRLYRGPGKREPVDEIRHEDDPGSRFKVE